VLAFTTIADRLLDAMKAEKAHICSPEETDKLRKLLFTEAASTWHDRQGRGVIAREAGFNAQGAKILVTPVTSSSRKRSWCARSSARCWPSPACRPSTRRFPRPLHDAEVRQGAFRCHPLEARGQHHGLSPRGSGPARRGQCGLLAGRLRL
jgi:hypothetical protein